jgi:hypothetical protein
MGFVIVCVRACWIGEKPIRLEQPDAEQERERDPTLRRAKEARLRDAGEPVIVTAMSSIS